MDVRRGPAGGRGLGFVDTTFENRGYTKTMVGERGRRPITFNWQQIEARMCAVGSRLVRGRHMENRDDLVHD